MILAVFDLDGTIIPLPEGSGSKDNFTWETFLEASEKFDAFHSTLTTLQWHRQMSHKVVVVTARPESERARTEALLNKVGFEFDELILRPMDLIESETEEIEQAEDDDEVKRILFVNHAAWRKGIRELFITRGDEISYAYDDQMPNLQIWREVGAAVWLVDKDGNLCGCSSREGMEEVCV